MIDLAGRFITIEGGEGAGKSTAQVRLRATLQNKGISVVCTREPGGTPLAESIRQTLLDVEGEAPVEMAELLLIFAARAQHLARVIEPALAAGKWVICDRFADSTLAYQGIAGGLGLDMVTQLQNEAIGQAVPDVTFLLDVRAEAGLKRAETRGGAARFEKKGATFHQTLRDGFLAIANENPDRICVIDAEESFDAVWGQIEQELARRFKL